MNKKAIAELIKGALATITGFGEFYGDEDTSDTNFSRWNARDIVGHINGWIKFSADKLAAIKTGCPFDDVGDAGIGAFNRAVYESHKNMPPALVLNETGACLDNYGQVLELYDENDLTSRDFPTGFPYELWKYMALDLYIHPCWHILHHHVRKGAYNEFVKTLEAGRECFTAFSDGNIEVYYFGDLFGNAREKNRCFNALAEKTKSTGNKFVERVIAVNMARS